MAGPDSHQSSGATPPEPHTPLSKKAGAEAASAQFNEGGGCSGTWGCPSLERGLVDPAKRIRPIFWMRAERFREVWCREAATRQNRWSHIHICWIEIGRDTLGVNNPSPRLHCTAQVSSMDKINPHNFWL